MRKFSAWRFVLPVRSYSFVAQMRGFLGRMHGLFARVHGYLQICDFPAWICGPPVWIRDYFVRMHGFSLRVRLSPVRTNSCFVWIQSSPARIYTSVAPTRMAPVWMVSSYATTNALPMRKHASSTTIGKLPAPIHLWNLPQITAATHRLAIRTGSKALAAMTTEHKPAGGVKGFSLYSPVSASLLVFFAVRRMS